MRTRTSFRNSLNEVIAYAETHHFNDLLPSDRAEIVAARMLLEDAEWPPNEVLQDPDLYEDLLSLSSDALSRAVWGEPVSRASHAEPWYQYVSSQLPTKLPGQGVVA